MTDVPPVGRAGPEHYRKEWNPVSLLVEITRRVKPPRALVVDRPLGYPLGLPNQPDLPRRILHSALALLPVAVSEPWIVPFEGA